MARPIQEIFLVTPYKEPTGALRQRWTKIGVAFAHRDRQGVSLRFHVTPSQDDLSKGNIVLRNIDNPRWASDDELEHRCNDADCCLGKR